MKRYSDEALQAVEGHPVPDDILADVYGMRADYARKTHDNSTAITYDEKALALKNPPQTQVNYGMSLGLSLQDVQRYADAARRLNETWLVSKQVFGATDSRTLRVGEVAALNDVFSNHVSEASAHFTQLLDDAQQASPVHPDLVAEIQLNRGELALQFEQTDSAVSDISQTIAFIDSHPNSEQRMVPEAKSALGYAYLQKGDLKRAEALFEQSIDFAREQKIPDNEVAEVRLAYVRAMRGNVDNALTLVQAARDGVAKGEGEGSFDAAEIHYFSGRILEMAERPADAEREYRAALASQMQAAPPDGMHIASADARFALGQLLARRATSRDEGRHFLDQAASLRDAALGADHPRVIESRKALAALTASH